MVSFNHFVSFVVTPFNIGLAILIFGAALLRWSRLKRTGKGFIVGGIVWVWIWMTPAMYGFLGRSLELQYPILPVDEIPSADAIAILGGGMGISTNVSPYAECWGSVDRVVHGARLYRAGKAKRVTVTGQDTDLSTIPMLVDLGVPRDAIEYVEGAGNTEEEGRLISKIVGERDGKVSDEVVRPPRILLVTSAWHMRRAVLMFRKAGLDVVPAPCDCETLVRMGREWHPSFLDFLPAADILACNTFLFKEHYAYWAYKWIRGF